MEKGMRKVNYLTGKEEKGGIKEVFLSFAKAKKGKSAFILYIYVAKREKANN